MVKKLLQRFSLLLLVSILVGCGEAELPYTDHSKDSVAFSRDIKSTVLNAAEDIKRTKHPEDSIRVIVQALSDLDACPTGDHLDIYRKIFSLSSELLKQAESGELGDLNLKLQEIIDLAQRLPGDVQIEKERAND